jgi:hypothetical protein
MAVDFGILAQTPSIGARYMEGMQMRQADAERNMLRQAQMEQMQFQRENMAAQRAERLAGAQERQARQARAAQRQQFLTGAADALAQGGQKLDRPTLMKVLQSGIQADEPSLVQFAREGMKALDDEELYQREAERFGLGGSAPAAPTNMFAGTMADIGTTQPAPVNALAAPAAAGVTREMVQNMLVSPSARIREQGKALAQTLPKEEATPSDVAAMKALGFPLTAAGYAQFRDAQRQERLLSPEEEAQRVRIARESRPLPQPREPKEPNKPVEVVGPDGKTIIVSAEEAIANRMTPAKAIEGLTPKERQQREAKFPQATSAVKTFETTSNTLIKDLETLSKHPGLGSITGIAAGRMPGITSAGREAEALFDKIVARGGFQELQNMRQASPTGGALGNVSNQEGAQLRQAFAALDRRQDAGSVRKAILDAINQIRTSQQTIKDAYDLTYEYKQGGGAASAPASPNIDALLNKYK